MDKNKKIIAGVLALCVLFLIYFAISKKAVAPSEGNVSTPTTQEQKPADVTPPENTTQLENPPKIDTTLTPEQIKLAADANDAGIKKSGTDDYKGAIVLFKKAHDIAPNDPRFIRNLAIAYTYDKDYVNAEAMFKLNFSTQPTAPEHWLELGDLYSMNLEDNVKADAFYLKAMQVSNNNIGVAQAYANFLEGENKYAEAIKYWQIVADGVTTNKASFLQHIEELKALVR